MAKKRRRKKKTNYFRYIILIALTIGVYFGYSKYMESKAFADFPSSLTTKSNSTHWWNDNYAYRREINSTNQNSLKYFVLNHGELVINSKSNEDGSDLILVSQDNSNKSTELPFEIRNIDEINVEIGFDSSSLISQKVFLYYGNKMPEKNNVLGTFSILDNAEEVSIGIEESPVVTIIPSHSWVLKENSGTKLDLMLNYDQSIGNYFEASYVIDQNEPVKVKSSGKNLEVNLSNIAIGKHSLFLLIKDKDTKYRTNTIDIIISAPVYVAWTLDWEGIDPTPENLADLEKVANEHKIPLIHYFNPRVLIHTAITKQRKQDIVNWLKKRIQNGDEFGMHMHMHHDMVEFAGIKPRETAPTWDGGTKGYDTPTSEYPYAEFLKLVNWAKSMFSQYNLPAPVGYRAGGWFADTDTLKALEDAGFKYDSSGRKPFALGSTGIQQAWTLDITTQPYYPSYTNQNNQGATDPMKLLEIPNNGMDSYWSETQQLIDNFYANYVPGTFLNEDIVIVYLTHPEWFNSVDKPKVKQLFNELDKYSYEKNKGPVKYVTLENYMKESVRLNEK